ATGTAAGRSARHLRRTDRPGVRAGDGAVHRRHRHRLDDQGIDRRRADRLVREEGGLAAAGHPVRAGRRPRAGVRRRVDAERDGRALLLGDHAAGRRGRCDRRLRDAAVRCAAGAVAGLATRSCGRGAWSFVDEGESDPNSEEARMPRVVHFEVPADDPARAAEFYARVFGWSATRWEGPMEYWLLTTGSPDQPGIDGGLMRRQAPGQGTVNTVDVPSVDEFIARIEQAGGKVVAPQMEIP